MFPTHLSLRGIRLRRMTKQSQSFRFPHFAISSFYSLPTTYLHSRGLELRVRNVSVEHACEFLLSFMLIYKYEDKKAEDYLIDFLLREEMHD